MSLYSYELFSSDDCETSIVHSVVMLMCCCEVVCFPVRLCSRKAVSDFGLFTLYFSLPHYLLNSLDVITVFSSFFFCFCFSFFQRCLFVNIPCSIPNLSIQGLRLRGCMTCSDWILVKSAHFWTTFRISFTIELSPQTAMSRLS